MISALSNLIAATPTAGTAEQVVYELARLRQFDDDRLPLAILAAVAAAILVVVWQLYRRDTAELPRGTGILLAALRLIAFVGLVVFFLGIERRATHEVIHNSQLAVLVDVSQSMGLADSDTTEAGADSRIDQVVTLLSRTPLMAQLRESHDVNVARFDQDVQPVVSLPRTEPNTVDEGNGKGNSDGGAAPQETASGEDSGGTSTVSSSDSESAQLTPTINWTADLQPRGTETRLGHALADRLRHYRNAPLAGIVVISDGAHNAGVEPSAAAAVARDAHVPIYTLGVGSTESQRNLALRDLVAPTRAFPGDTMSITGYLQASGYAGRLVDVQLYRRRAEEPAGAGLLITSQRVAAGADGEMTPVAFAVEPSEAGNFVFLVRVVGPADDANPRDNQREAEVDVVDRQTRVLLFAGGPTRDYRFLRDQLHRDPTMTVDVLLQSAKGNISQDAHEILAAFPSTRDELYQYDCLVAFDPDWTQLDAVQVELIEAWVADEAGGMIVIAGPIHTSRWVRSTEHAKLRDLYPVVFQQRLTVVDDGQYGGDVPWPLDFERAGREARFLWLADTADESAALWDSFAGVYGYYAVKGPKSGATVYARFSDPQAGLGDERPVYLAGHFYGAGQVFYVGSGELWRLRMVDPTAFEVLTTKLVRHVSQGRILRGSSRGSLVVERDRYELGETAVLRARLADERHEPLLLDRVTAQVVRPDGSTDALALVADVSRPGMYVGQWTVLQEGTYHVALSVPGSSEEPLSRYVQARVPDLERTHAERNEPLLAALAQETGGIYYPQMETAVRGDDQLRRLATSIVSRTETKRVKGARDPDFEQWQMRWLLGVIAVALFAEWTIRRLSRLA